MIVPLLAFLGAVLLALYFAFSWDTEVKRSKRDKQKVSQTTLWSILAPLLPCLNRQIQVTPEHNIEMTTINNHEGSESATSVALSSEELTLRKEWKRRERKAFQEKLKGKSVGSEHSILDDALPEVFRSNTYIEKLTAELKRHHRWFNIVYYYSDVYPRALRVLSLATNIIATIFFIAITYSIANPDDNDCPSYTDKDDCLVSKSHFQTGQPQCRWDNNAMRCSFVQPSVLIRVILFVVIFAVMLAIPVNVVTNYLIQYVLAAPIRVTNGEMREKENAQKYQMTDTEGNDNLNDAALNIPVYSSTTNASNTEALALEQSQMKPVFDAPSSMGSPPVSPTNENNYRVTDILSGKLDVTTVTTPLLAKYKSHRDRAHKELESLQSEVRKHRATYMTGVLDRRKFDRLWNLSPSGHFIIPEPLKVTDTCSHRCAHFASQYCSCVFTNPAQARADLYQDILRALRAETTEIAHIKAHSLSEQDVGRILLVHLHVDLLPTTAGNILFCKGQRDQPAVLPVSWWYKILAWVLILAVNGNFLYTLFAFAATQSDARCTAWFKSFMLFIVVDCVGLATNRVLATHVIVPCLALSEVQRVKEYLIHKLQQHDLETQKTAVVNAQLGRMPIRSSTAVAINDSSADAMHSTTPLTLTQPPLVFTDLESGATSQSFNAGMHLFTSHRLSVYFPSLYEAQIVQLFILQMPRLAQYVEILEEMQAVKERKSEHNTTSVTANSKNYVRAGNLVTTLLYVAYVCVLPFVHLVILLPLFIQDMILDYITVVLFGYLLLLHIILYAFYPPLAFVPPFVGSVLAHFIIVSGNGAMQTKLANMKKQTLAARQEQRKLNNRRTQLETGDAKSGITPYEVAHKKVVTIAVTAPPASASAPASAGNTKIVAQQTTTSTTASPNTKTQNALPVVSNSSTPQSPHSAHTQNALTPVKSPASAPAPHSPNNSPKNAGANAEERDSRLKHFLTSADKVLHTQEEHTHHLTSPSVTAVAEAASAVTAATKDKHQQLVAEDKSEAQSSMTSMNTSFNTVMQPHQSWSNLKATDKNSPKGGAPSPNKGNRLVKKASRPANTFMNGASGGTL